VTRDTATLVALALAAAALASLVIRVWGLL
jgi:hypothetical protein